MQPPPLRFHHFHYRVDDPAAAINDAAATLKGTRIILQGMGVGVRAGSEYLLFDRADPDLVASGLSRTRESLNRTPPELYGDAVRWLRERGLAVTPPGLAEAGVAGGVSDLPLDHIAFAADDLDAVVAAIGRAGVMPPSRRASSVFFTLPSGMRVEIVRSTDRPDAFWCPMHPDVRSADAGKCALCGMDLAPIPTPRVGEYKMDVSVAPGRVRFVIRDPDGVNLVEHFADVHERPFHLFIVSRDLSYFAHEHPHRVDGGAFELSQRLPPGEYMLIADFLPQGGTPQMLQRAIVAEGYRGRLFQVPSALEADASEKQVDGTRVRLDAADLSPRRAATLRVTLSDASRGTPVEDLEPYLGAAGHMLIVNADLTEAFHAHPENKSTRGPSLTFDPVLPAPGKYKLWVQFQRRGKVTTVPFVVDVN